MVGSRLDRVSCRQGSNVVSGCCTTRLENTHGTEIRELLYPWHPWFALWVAVHEAIDKSDGVVFRCGLTGSDAGRWLEVPAWMFDRSACAGTRIAPDAHADLAALTMLATLLRHALNDHFASSNASRFRAHQDSLATRIGERSMPRQTTLTPARRRAPQQLDLFAGASRTKIGGMPAWSGLPTEAQAALTDLMTRLILDHADKNWIGSMTEAGHDL